MLSTSFSHNITFVTAHGLLWALIVLTSWYECTIAIALVLLNYLLDPAPPPWAQAKQYILTKPRHFRKHGQFKILPLYPTIQRRHMDALLLILFASPTNTHAISNTPVAIQLRHTAWELSATIPPFSLD